MRNFILISAILLFFSCQKEEYKPSKLIQELEYIGTWDVYNYDGLVKLDKLLFTKDSIFLTYKGTIHLVNKPIDSIRFNVVYSQSIAKYSSYELNILQDNTAFIKTINNKIHFSVIKR